MVRFERFRAPAVAALALFALAPAAVAPAAAQQIGREAYSPPARNPGFAAQAQLQERMLGKAAASGMGALHQYVTNYNSSSTSVGNLNEINMILGEGANGHISNNAAQDSSGSQSADASTDVDVSTQITEILQGDQAGGGDGNGNGNGNGTPQTGMPQ